MEYIGLDIGGTNIRVGKINQKEELIFEHLEKTLENVTTADDLYNKIKSLIKLVPNYKECRAIGIGAPGSINKKTGNIETSQNISLLNNYPFIEKLTKEFDKPIILENDARVAAFAEAISGDRKEKDIVCYITISTGLGGGVMKSKDRFLSEVIDNFKKEAHPLAKNTIIETANLQQPGIIGAALLAKSIIEK